MKTERTSLLLELSILPSVLHTLIECILIQPWKLEIEDDHVLILTRRRHPSSADVLKQITPSVHVRIKLIQPMQIRLP